MKEKIFKFLKSKTLFAFVFNVAIMAICIIVTSFSFESSDDFLNSVNICQKHFYYSSSINYILAVIVGSAQYAFRDFNCYVLAQILLSCSAFTAITFVFADKFNKKIAFGFSAIINILFALNHYQNINSNRTSALLLTAGFLLVLNAIRNKRYNLPCWIGVAMISFGSFYNYVYFFVALGFAVAFFFGDLISKKKFKLPFRKFFWYFRPFLLMFLLVTIVVFGLNQFSYSVNHATDEASDFYNYSYLKTSINNNLPYPNFEDYEEKFADVGINSKGDYELLKSGYYDSEKALNLDALQTVYDIQKEEKSNAFLTSFTDIFTDNYHHFASFDCEAIIILVFIGLGILFVIYQKNRFGFFPIFYVAAGLISSLLLRYFYSGAKYLMYGNWLLMVVLLFYSLNFEKGRTKHIPQLLKIKHGNLIIALAVIICLGAGYISVYTVHNSNNKDTVPQSLISEIERSPHKYYVFDTKTAIGLYQFSENYMHPLWGFKDGYLDNVDTFGYFHNTENLIKRNMPTNIYEAVLTNREIYVIDKTSVNIKEQYFTNNYTRNGHTVRYKLLNNIDNYCIYNVIVE